MRIGRAIAGGVLAELLLMVAVIPGAVMGSETLVTWVAVCGSPVMTYLAALWVGRRLESRFVLHGCVVGVTAMLIYVIPAIAGGMDQPAIYWVAHALKIAGGTAGGAFAARRMMHATVGGPAQERL
jgi:putative membrane protein (TIGR04086 family)